VDAIALPFVQGQLRDEELSVSITTACAVTGQPIHLDISSDLACHVEESAADPWLVMPLVDFATLDDPSIVDAFWRKSVFFWSEEQARHHRRTARNMRGLYFRLEQGTEIIRLIQSAIFAFSHR
jgi:hypothetical protein